MIIPEINFDSFYGGYIAKFNLAKLLVERGHEVRILLVDQCSQNSAVWQQCVGRYPGIENVLDKLNIEYCFGRKKTIIFSPDDGVIATTWWTAYIADSLIKNLNVESFLYMIQEYEPFTFEMGSYFAVAHESYNLPHSAIFSSSLLQQYFQDNNIGVYASKPIGAGESFENAIISYSTGEIVKPSRAVKKLLFYARPEAHASRNMFEIAYQALASAIDRGVFKGQWEFYGIGTQHGDIPLPNSRVLKMLGKFDLVEYRQALLGYDVGLALMYTPHPSLLPLEMAAAGMVVVTSTCMNKTEDKLKEISKNIMGAKPTIDGVTDCLGRAVEMVVSDTISTDQPLVKWSSDWTTTFDKQKIDKICHWVFGQ